MRRVCTKNKENRPRSLIRTRPLLVNVYVKFLVLLVLFFPSCSFVLISWYLGTPATDDAKIYTVRLVINMRKGITRIERCSPDWASRIMLVEVVVVAWRHNGVIPFCRQQAAKHPFVVVIRCNSRPLRIHFAVRMACPRRTVPPGRKVQKGRSKSSWHAFMNYFRIISCCHVELKPDNLWMA